MQTVELAGTGRSFCRIGLGCGRLVGGASLKASAKVVEAALELGITHFDVAPSYGLGLAEDVLGEVLGGNRSVTIATKVGIARPSGGGRLAIARKVLKPVLSLVPSVKRRLARSLANPAARNQFDRASIEASFADSLSRLKRDSVDLLLLHEPGADLDVEGVLAACDPLVATGKVKALGSSTGAAREGVVPFGSVSQYRWSGERQAADSARGEILHGLLRHGLESFAKRAAERPELSVALGCDLKDARVLPGLLVTIAMAERPDAVFLLSTTNADRLRESISRIDWETARAPSPAFLAAGRELIGTAS